MMLWTSVYRFAGMPVLVPRDASLFVVLGLISGFSWLQLDPYKVTFPVGLLSIDFSHHWKPLPNPAGIQQHNSHRGQGGITTLLYMEASVNIKAALFWATKLMHSSRGRQGGEKGWWPKSVGKADMMDALAADCTAHSCAKAPRKLCSQKSCLAKPVGLKN